MENEAENGWQARIWDQNFISPIFGMIFGIFLQLRVFFLYMVQPATFFQPTWISQPASWNPSSSNALMQVAVHTSCEPRISSCHCEAFCTVFILVDVCCMWLRILSHP
eukprot:EG_transcript_42196